MAAARQLIAQRGYRGTSVGDIEAAAGLSPRSGALYKHFPSKQAVLEAVMAEHSAAVEEMREQIAVVPLGDLRAELTLIARWGLAELRREHELTRIVMREGENFPELAATFRAAIVESGHRLATVWVRSRADALGAGVDDPEAFAAVLTGSLVGYTLQELLFGPAAGGVDDDRFVAAWVDSGVALIEKLVEERSPANA